jgi:hypothetical protein
MCRLCVNCAILLIYYVALFKSSGPRIALAQGDKGRSGADSSGGKERLGRTSKRGDEYIRCLLVAGAVAILRHARNLATKDAAWGRALLARRPAKVVAVALANRPHCLGRDGARRSLPSQGDRRASNLKGLSVPQDCEGEEEVMAKRSSRGSGRLG